MWLTRRRPTIGVRYSWMRASINTPYINRARIPALTRGLLPSSSKPQWHGLEIGPIFRQEQGPQGPLEMETKLRKTKTWPMWWTFSLEEAESHDQGRQTCDLSLFDIIAFNLFCYFHCDKTELTLLLSVVFVISIVIKLNWHYCFQLFLLFPLWWNWTWYLLSVICYLIVSNFTASSILSYVLYNGLPETPKIEVLCIFIARLLFLSIKHNLRYQLCPGCKPFLIIFA